MRAQSLALYALSAIVVAAGASCGLSGDPESIFADGGGGGSGGHGGASTSSGGGDATTTTTTTSGGNGGNGGGATTTTSTTTGSGGGVTVPCNGQECAAGQVCCFRAFDPSLSMCGAPGSCPDGFAELSCNEPTDCPGSTCCGNYNGQNYTGVACQDVCEGFSKIIQCEGDPSVCPAPQTCHQSMILGQGYSFCQ